MTEGLDPSPPWSGLRVALVHDWITGRRGGEKVLDALCRIFPDADLLTLVHVRGAVGGAVEARRVRASFVNHLPQAARHYRRYLPLFPAAIETFDLDEVDLVISTSHCAAKAVVPSGRAFHLCYCHSPMRYAWDQFDAYFGPDRVGRLPHAVLRPIMAWLARWDRATAPRVHRFLANSGHVAGRIARYYNREASVVYPPVDTDFFTPDGGGDAGYALVVSALVPYKRIEIAIAASERLGVPLIIAGTGPDEARLRSMAGPSVTFRGSVTDEALRDLYRQARALLLPGVEDFGIAVVEAMACGCPVVALGRGGATETIDDGVTGILVRDGSAEAFSDGMTKLDHLACDPAALRRRALAFSREQFDARFRQVLGHALSLSRC